MSEARINEYFESLYADDQQLRNAPLLAESHEIASDGCPTIFLRPGGATMGFVCRRRCGSTVRALRTRRCLPSPERFDGLKRPKASIAGQSNCTSMTCNSSPKTNSPLRYRATDSPKRPFATAIVSQTNRHRPFQVVRFNDDNSVALQRYDGYRVRAGLPNISMREVTDKSYQARLPLPKPRSPRARIAKDLARLQNNRERSCTLPTNSWWYIGFNLNRSPFNDVRVRQAIGHSIDVGALLAPIGTGELISGPFVPSSPYYNHDVPVRGYNPVYATQLLEDAGFEKVNGLWRKGNQTLSLRITAHKRLESSQEVVINLQSQLKSQGIEVFVDFLDEAMWKANIWRGQDFDMLLSKWSFDRMKKLQSTPLEGLNFTGYDNSTVDELLDDARDARIRIPTSTRQLHSIVQEALMLFLWTLDSYSAMSSNVRTS